MENTKKIYSDKISYANNIYHSLENADALIIATEWTIFRRPDFDKVRNLLNNPIIFDGRNLYNPEEMFSLNLEYHCVGRKTE